MLKSFEIVNFRVFERLRIERLGRVNLIVGKNGVGKTTLLEALRFYGMGSPLALREYLADQEEWAVPAVTGELTLDLRTLFHGRNAGAGPIELGPVDDSNVRLQLRLIDAVLVPGRGYREKEAGEKFDEAEGDPVKVIVVQRGNARVHVPPEASHRRQLRGKYSGPAFVPARGVAESDLNYWWEHLALTPSEEQVLEMLSLLEQIDGIATVEDPTTPKARIFKVRVKGDIAPVPLSSLGGGLTRLFSVAVALEYSRVADNDRGPSLLDEIGDTPWHERVRLLLVDEIENGIHYSAHADLWKAVFRLAREHDVQVFATTHSWDCLEGFQKAAAHDQENDGLVIRLERVEGEKQTGAVIIGRDDLPIVVRDSIEVR